ncbi:MAG: aminopeptidase [Spirochaetes bacterium]|nr:aminopeptidase [Deltaproteobacteria bacterium]RKX99263.1 MAG: aminopeptidase [Spirochaetota bacterium]
MLDIRVKRLASLLVNYCLDVKPNENILITGSVASAQLIQEVYREVLKKGAFPRTKVTLPSLEKIFLDEASMEQLKYLSSIDKYEVENSDGFINILSTDNTKSLSNVDSSKIAILTKSRDPLKKIILQKDRWVLTLFPTLAYAQDAEMSLDEFEDFVYNGCYVNKEDPIAYWKKLHDEQQRLIDYLKGKERVRIIGEDTDITFSIKDRVFINSDGHRNMPSGEIFTGPQEDSVNGFIRFSYPVCTQGKEIEDIRLKFKDGKVVEAKASKNEDFLRNMLEIDEGAKRIGEFGIGTNFGIKKFIKNILFDEKIGGTIHLALGSSYPETGGKVISALHWDMIKDLRSGGKVIVDDEIIMQDGKLKFIT